MVSLDYNFMAISICLGWIKNIVEIKFSDSGHSIVDREKKRNMYQGKSSELPSNPKVYKIK